MNIVVLGGTGFIGKALLKQLMLESHAVRVLTRNAAKHREVKLIPGVNLSHCDIHDAEQLSAQMKGMDVAVNLVGILNESGNNGKGFHHAHVTLTEKLVQACRAAGVKRVLHMSSLKAGEGSSYYLKTKGLAEERLLAATDLDVTIFQPSVVFGPGDGLFNRFAGLLKLTPVMPLACPDARMQPVYVNDVAAAFVASLSDRSTIGRRYALVGPHSYSLKELVRFTADTLGLKRWIIGLPGWMAALQARVMDFVPGKPFSMDNYRSLQVDSVSQKNDLRHFHVTPKSIERIVPGYLGTSKHQQHLDKLRRRR